MAFTQSYSNNGNGGNGGMMNAQGERKKTNFSMQCFYGQDARLDIGIWVANNAVYTILMIKQEIGKDPSTGNSTYEQKAPKELPRIFLNMEYLRAFLNGLTGNQDNFDITPKNGKLIITGNNSETMTMKIETSLGTRTITFKGIPIGSTFDMAQKENLIDIIRVALKKALFSKLDPEEFGPMMGNDNGDEENPF